MEAQSETFDRAYSMAENMEAPLLESALPVRSGQLGAAGGVAAQQRIEAAAYAASRRGRARRPAPAAAGRQGLRAA
jgi:hypothetical protein